MDLMTLLESLSITSVIVIGLIAMWALLNVIRRPRCYGLYYAVMHNKPNCWRCTYRTECREKSEL